MKKLLAILAVAGFVACNNSGEEKKTEGGDTGDTTKIENQAPVTPDTTGGQKTDTTGAAAGDTSAAK